MLPKKPRRKSIRKEAIKTIIEGTNNRITFTLKRNGEPKTEIETKTPNPEKILFGRIQDGQNKLEICSYDKTYHQNGFIFLNGERIMVDKFALRELWSSIAKMGHFLGVSRRRGSKNDRKK